MNRGFAAEVKRIIIFTLLCALFGFMNGYLAPTLIAGGAVYMGWMLWQIYRLDIWLKNSRTMQPPDAGGIWGDIFDSITRLQKRQKREKLRLQAVVKRGQETTAALRDGIILLDKKGNIDWYNASAGHLLNLRHQDQGNPLVNYVRHPRFIDYLETGDFREHLDLPSPQTEDVRLQYEITHFGKGESLLLVRDVTRLHNLEQMRKDFVANVSHELRTPLTVIRGYVETLGMSPDLPDMWKRALDQMEQQGLRMTNLINGLLALSKLETDDRQSTHKPVALKPLLERIKSDAKALSGDKQHNIELHSAEGLTLLGSEQELQSAFSNLVFNAVKYSSPNKDIIIQVTKNNLGLMVSVQDEGEGIDAMHLPRLTERFYRVDGSRQIKTGGTGLGLAIVKHVLLRHGGKLDIKSKVGKGSTFTCIFPIQSVVSEALSARETSA